MYRFHHGGLRSGSLMFEPCYTFLNNSRNGAVSIYGTVFENHQKISHNEFLGMD